MIRFLASVRDEHEAVDALAGGADIVDFKDPSTGALGAAPLAAIERALARLAGRVATSATAGDWPLMPRLLVDAARRVGATGVDYVKLGLLPGDALGACIDALGGVTSEHRLVAVFFADHGVPLAALPALRAAGFAGAMIDTFDKRVGGLRRYASDAELARFVRAAHAAELLAGLAGSLALADIPALTCVGPDLLGFRGALCEADRASVLSPERTRDVRAALEAAAVTVP